MAVFFTTLRTHCDRIFGTRCTHLPLALCKWQQYTTRVKCELDTITEKEIAENGLKPRKHRGRIKCNNIALPPEIHEAMIKSSMDYPLKSLINDGNRLNNCIRSRRWFPTDDGIAGRKKTSAGEREVPSSAQRQKSSVFDMHDTYSCLTQLIGRSDAEYAVLKRIFTEISQRDPELRPRSFLDFGSGVGTGTWAVTEFWRDHLFEIMSVDKSRHMNDLAELVLRQGDPNKAATVRNVFYRQFLPANPNRKYDIVLSAFSLFDQSTRRGLLELVDQLYTTFDKYLIFVEQGSNAGFQLLDGIRNHIRRNHGSDDSHLFAPCPHSLACPRIAKDDGTPCNFEATYTRNFPSGDGHQYGSILYSYLVYKKNPPDSAQGFPRLVRPTAVRSKHCVCHVCAADGKLRDVTFTSAKHGQVIHRCAKASRWADLLPTHVEWEDRARQEGDSSEESPTKT
uniref:Methyltransferase domain-containing protein n=1 Tax=Anopheles atroparvus TaxID=41427 RepID=A0AAG5CZF3_ANOAO